MISVADSRIFSNANRLNGKSHIGRLLDLFHARLSTYHRRLTCLTRAVTAVLSVLVIYLMITRTPENGRALARYLILMQASLSILIVDLGWGFLVCPVFFFPLTALLCNGVLCGSETSKHAGVVVLFQCTVQVAIALSFTLHYKYTAIARLTNHRQITVTENMIVRLIFFFALEMPVAVIVVSGASQQEIQMFMRSEHQLALLSLLEDDVALIGIAYSIRRFLWIPITLAAVVLVTTAISERTRKLQRGLTYTLVMQLGMPLAIQVLPIFIYVFSMTLFLFTPGAMNFLLCIQLCHASFHTIFLILTTPSYRRAIWCSSRHHNDASISAIHSIMR